MARKLEVQIVGDASSLNRAFGQASGGASKFGSAFGLLAKAAALGGAAIATGIGASIKAAGDFQSSLNTLKAVSGATGAQMKAVSALSIRLGADLSLPATSAKDAAEAMTELSKAGLSMKDVMAAAKGVLQLSAAAEISNADAAKIAANALNAFGLEGKEAGRVADLLAAASIAASGEMTDMADALGMVSATAAQAHIPIEDVVTAIGELANKGIFGGSAGAALQQMLLKLESPTKKGAAALKDLGVNIYDAGGHMKSVRSLIDQFSKATENMSDKQRNSAMNALFGSRAIRAANIVLLGGVKAFDSMKDAVTRQGAAADLAAAKMKGFNGAIQGLKSQAETAAILIGSALLPSATKFVSGINNLMADLMKAHTFKAKLNVLWDFGTSIKDALVKAWSGTDMGTIASRNTSGAGMSKGLEGMIQSAFAGVNWTAVGVTIADGISTGIGTAGAIAKKLVEVISKTMDSIDWNQLGRTAGPGLAAALLSAFATILDPGFWVKNWDLALAVGLTAFGGVFGKIGGKLGTIVGPMLRKPFEDAILAVAGVVERLSPKIGEALLTGLSKLPGLIGKALGGLAAPVEAAFGKLSKVAQFTVKVLGIDAVIKAIAGLATAVYNKLAQIPGDILRAAGGWKGAAIKLGLALVAGVEIALISLVPGVVSKLAGIAGAITSAVGRAAGAARALGAAIVNGVINGLAGLIKGINGKLAGIPGALLAAAAGAASAAAGIGASIASNLLAGLGNIAADVAKKVGGAISSGLSSAYHLAGKLHHGSGDFQDTIHLIGEPLVNGIVEGVNKGAPKIGKALDSALKAALKTAGQSLKDAQAEVNKLTAQMSADAAKATDKQNAQALASAEAAVAAAKKSGKGMADAIKQVRDAQQAMTDTANQRELDQAQKHLDAVQSKFDKAKAMADAFAASMVERRQAVSDSLKSFGETIKGIGDDIGLSFSKVMGPGQIQTAAARIAAIEKLLNSPIKVNKAKLLDELSGLTDGINAGLDKMKQAVDDGKSKVAAAWEAFGSKILDTFQTKVVDKFQTGLDDVASAFEDKTLLASVAQATSDLATAALADPETAALVQKRIDLWKEYYADLKAGNFAGAKALQDQIIAAESALTAHLNSLSDDQKTAAQSVADAGDTLISALKSQGDKAVEQVKNTWETVGAESKARIDQAISAAQTALDAGKVTLPQALGRIRTALIAEGMDPADADKLLRDPLATSLGQAVKDLATATGLLVIALDGIATAMGLSVPGLHDAAARARAAMSGEFFGLASDAEAAALRVAAAVSAMEFEARKAAGEGAFSGLNPNIQNSTSANIDNSTAAGSIAAQPAGVAQYGLHYDPGSPGGHTAGFAKGGEVWKRQLAWVGEAGHELIIPVNKIPTNMRNYLIPMLRNIIGGNINFQPPPGAFSSAGGFSLSPSAGGSGGFAGMPAMRDPTGTVVHNWNFSNYVGDKRELMQVVRTELQRTQSRNR